MDVSEVTQEQLDALESKATTLEKEKGESAVKLAEYETAKTAWEAKEKEFAEQSNPNWAKARKSMEAMKTALKEKGIEVDDDGNVKSNPQNLNVEEIRKEATQAARNELLGGRLQELLSEYDPKSAELVKHYYNKLTAGESVNLQNIRSFVTQAENVAKSNPDTTISRVVEFSGGQGPRIPDTDKLDSKVAQDLGEKMGLSFAKKK